MYQNETTTTQAETHVCSYSSLSSLSLSVLQDLARTLASRWKDLEKSRKKVFEDEAKALWDEYELKLADYKAKHGGKGPDEVNGRSTNNNDLSEEDDEAPQEPSAAAAAAGHYVNGGMGGPHHAASNAAALDLLRRSSFGGPAAGGAAGIPGMTDPTALMQQQILLAAQRAHRQAQQQSSSSSDNNNNNNATNSNASGIRPNTASSAAQQQQMMNNLRNLQHERDMIQRITSMVQAQATRPLLAAGMTPPGGLNHAASSSSSSSSSQQQQQQLHALLQQQQAVAAAGLGGNLGGAAGRNGHPGEPLGDSSSQNRKRSAAAMEREDSNGKQKPTGSGPEESAHTRYRFDRHDPVEVSKRRVQFTIRGQPKWWGAKVQDDLRQVTQELFQVAGYKSVPQFSENQLLQVTLIFAFGKDKKSIHNVGDTDDLSKFVMEAYKGCLFANHGQVLSIQARKKFDIPGGAGYTMVVLEEEVDFSESGTAAV